MRSRKVAFDDLPGELPLCSVPDNTDLNKIAQNAVIKLNSLQSDHLTSKAIWRDLLAFTDYFRTFYGRDTILRTLKKLSLRKKRSLFRVKEGREPRIGKAAKGSSWVDVDVLFTAQHGNLAQNCMGTVSVVIEEDGRSSVWMLRTWLECFDGYGHPDVLEPKIKHQQQPVHRPSDNEMNGLFASNGSLHSEEYGAIVVGAGQAGLAVGGRLKALGVSYIILDNHAGVGDVWTNRYESLRWHTSKEYGNLPFGHTYPEHDDYAMPTKRIGAGHRNWVERYRINVRTSTSVDSARWDAVHRKWTITASTPDGSISLAAKNIVLAIGPGHATPVYPSWATSEEIRSRGFKGTIFHSFEGVSLDYNDTTAADSILVPLCASMGRPKGCRNRYSKHGSRCC